MGTGAGLGGAVLVGGGAGADPIVGCGGGGIRPVGSAPDGEAGLGADGMAPDCIFPVWGGQVWDSVVSQVTSWSALWGGATLGWYSV